VYDQKQMNKAQYQLQRLRALVFRDFFRALVTQTRRTNARVIFGKRDADALEYKKIALVAKTAGSKSSASASASASDKAGEFTMFLHQVGDVDIDFYANTNFEHISVATSISCTENVYPLVADFANKLFPGLIVRRIGKNEKMT
jgi:hypothetical protein